MHRVNNPPTMSVVERHHPFKHKRFVTSCSESATVGSRKYYPKLQWPSHFLRGLVDVSIIQRDLKNPLLTVGVVNTHASSDLGYYVVAEVTYSSD
ncbi:hypothetical protein EYZ11_011506 [Aspergillus tanneri]|uniref:Uncharacterized protein n=1 Tax=Aspergillus tanneri TaxID=1220188 RepID=A0A4S3J2M7_9EURO|nr:hypothetical protein EYZ11_011506 [Aspergillus tanneri]